MHSRLTQIQERPFISALILCLFIFFGLFLLSDGFYFQTESDTVFPTYIFGFYSDGENVLPNSFGCFSVLSNWFNYLHKKGVSASVYDWFHVCSAFLCFSYWIHFFICSKKENWFAIPFIISLLDVIMPFEFSKTAIVLAATGLSIISLNESIFKQLAGAMILTIGALVRPEPAVIATILFGISIALQAERSSVFHAFRKLFIPLVVLGGLSVMVFNTENTYKDVEYKQIRPYEYTLVDFRKEVFNTDALSEVDSIKIQAAQRFFFADKQEINTQFFEQIGIRPMDKTPVSLVSNFFEFSWVSHGLEQFIWRVRGLKFHFLFLTALFLTYVMKNEKKALLIAVSMTLICSMSVFLKTEPHFITGTMMCTVLLSIRNDRQTKVPDPGNALHGGKNFWLAVVVASVATLALREKIKIVASSKCKSDYYTKLVEELPMFSPSDLVLNISFWDKLHYKLFTPIQPADSDKMTVMDGGVLYLSNGYQNMLSKRTETKTFFDQYLWLINKRKIFVSSKERMRLLTDYVNVVYDQELKYIRLNHIAYGSCPVSSTEIGFYQYSIENQINVDGELMSSKN